MRSVIAGFLLVAAGGVAAAATHPFTARDLAMMDRVGAPVVSPDGNTAAFSVRSTDWDANKGVHSLWTVPVAGGEAHEIVSAKIGATDPHFSADGKVIYFLAPIKDVNALWRVPAAGGKAEVVSSLPLDINTYRISPDGKTILLSVDVFEDCPLKSALECSADRLQARKDSKATGMLYKRLFVRHWNVWMDGRRSQLFTASLSDDGKLGTLHWITHGIDGDTPSKPWGDASEFVFSPDSKTVYFDVRIAGHSEPWSTNFDVYSVPADGSAAPKNLTAANKAWDAYPVVSHDGKTLYYLAMKTPAFEADRFGIMALDLASGKRHEVDPNWDRSAGPMALSADGKTLYTTVDDNGDHALFAVDVASGKATHLVGSGKVTGFELAGANIVLGREDFQHPADLYRLHRGKLAQITHFNAKRLSKIAFGDAQWFTFKGWNGDTVQGYVMKPVGYKAGHKYPVAFLVHGGPQGSWTNEFHYRWNPETYAGQGFAVVAINFHGSTGYGQAFTDAISQHWGDRPLEDLQKGWTAALSQFSYLDGDRACALGASYGGYMVYWMAGVWNQPWKCLVDHDGVFDSRMMYYATEELWFEEHENGGTQYDHPANYEKFNPLNHVKDWKDPMLIIHSDNDFRIPITQGLGAFTALQRQGIPSEYLRYPDETHFVSKPRNSVQWHHIVNAWIEKWTKAEK